MNRHLQSLGITHHHQERMIKQENGRRYTNGMLLQLINLTRWEFANYALRR